jgi:outer membrane protein OmpA-like peptidoglycan-associated protein
MVPDSATAWDDISTSSGVRVPASMRDLPDEFDEVPTEVSKLDATIEPAPDRTEKVPRSTATWAVVAGAVGVAALALVGLVVVGGAGAAVVFAAPSPAIVGSAPAAPAAAAVVVEAPVVAAPAPALRDAAATVPITAEALAPFAFAFGSARPDVASDAALAAFAARIRVTDQGVLLVGHTDSIGTRKVNEAVGLARANAVRGLLVEREVPIDRIEVASAGESQPIASNASAEGRALNRRVTAHPR